MTRVRTLREYDAITDKREEMRRRYAALMSMDDTQLQRIGNERENLRIFPYYNPYAHQSIGVAFTRAFSRDFFSPHSHCDKPLEKFHTVLSEKGWEIKNDQFGVYGMWVSKQSHVYEEAVKLGVEKEIFWSRPKDEKFFIPLLYDSSMENEIGNLRKKAYSYQGLVAEIDPLIDMRSGRVKGYGRFDKEDLEKVLQIESDARRFAVQEFSPEEWEVKKRELGINTQE